MMRWSVILGVFAAIGCHGRSEKAPDGAASAPLFTPAPPGASATIVDAHASGSQEHPPAAPALPVDVHSRIDALTASLGKSLGASRSGPDARFAVAKTPSLLMLLGRNTVAWCRQPKPVDAILVFAPPGRANEMALPRYTNPQAMGRYALDEVALATGALPDGRASACPRDAGEFLWLDHVQHPPQYDLVEELRGKGMTPKSAVVAGFFCREHAASADAGLVTALGGAKRVFVCNKVALVYDLVDDTWVRLENGPERPDRPQDVDKDGRPEFPRTAMYFSNIDINRPETALDPRTFIIDAPAFEAWDGKGFGLAAPKLAGAYVAAYDKDDTKAYHLLERAVAGDRLDCDLAFLQVLSKATVFRAARLAPWNLPTPVALHDFDRVIADGMHGCTTDYGYDAMSRFQKELDQVPGMLGGAQPH